MLTEATSDPKYMNEVRARVSLPAYGAIGYPTKYNTVELALEHESQVEFASEFHRQFDLIRTGRAIPVIKSSGKNITITEDKLLLPIPFLVINQNLDVITQNEAYKQKLGFELVVSFVIIDRFLVEQTGKRPQPKVWTNL